MMAFVVEWCDWCVRSSGEADGRVVGDETARKAKIVKRAKAFFAKMAALLKKKSALRARC